MLQRIFFCVVMAAVATFVSSFMFRRLAFSTGILDQPADRKIHADAIPLLGGASIVTGVVLPLVLSGIVRNPQVAFLLGCGVVVFAVNLIDDARGLSARLRFAVEVAVALVMIFGVDARISFLPQGVIFDTIEVLLTVIWFVGLTNAVNYLDGMDGLASGLAGIAASFFAFMLLYTNQLGLGLLALVVAASSFGFLPHNFPRARMFLGDAGSTFLGFMLAGIGALGGWAQFDIVRIAAPVLVLGVPIFDMTFTTITRIATGKVHNVTEWLRYGGKDHFHHSLVDLGLSRRTAVMFIWLVAFALGLSGVMVRGAYTVVGIVTLLQAMMIFLIIGILIVVGNQKQSGWHL
jgi:UDP-GlcNAc:undecaprenyl-phosphate GlcNAc-1-phosphate transferase